MAGLLSWTLLGIGLVITGGTLLSLSRHPHWWVRMWDFPKLHLAALAALSGGGYALFFSSWHWWEEVFTAVMAGCVAWHAWRIFPYTPLAAVQVQASRAPTPEAVLRLLIVNVLMQNRQYDRFIRLVRQMDPDVVLALEIDARWLTSLQPLERLYPYVVRQPQENTYGMLLLSRLKLLEPQVQFLVQPHVPSIHTQIELRSGVRIRFYGLHPRPPNPLRDQNATPRNAELLTVGDEIRQHQQPTVVAGDLNDVGWSKTTKRFLRLSRLLDPRVGRGLYNTYNANNPLVRWPLDHVFHCACFTLATLQRLPHMGSDHFPMYIELCYEPEASSAAAGKQEV